MLFLPSEAREAEQETYVLMMLAGEAVWCDEGAEIAVWS